MKLQPLRFETVGRFLAELRRRKVVKVAAVYAVVGWLVIQIGSNTFEALHLPPWALTFVIVITALGFPIALVIAWSIELTPMGIRAEQPAQQPGSAASPAAANLASALGPAGAARSTAATHRSPRRPRSVPASEDGKPEFIPALPTGKVFATQLRHDLRTPMNAILGYSELLVSEADELGIQQHLPQLQRLHEDAKGMLERINEAVPGTAAFADADVETIRARTHAALLQPAHDLLEQTKSVFASAGKVDAAHSDLDRLLTAVAKLAALAEGLAAVASAGSQAPAAHEVEQTLDRLRPAAKRGADASGTVLVVDDNAPNRDLVSRHLVREGYNVQAVATGREAIETLRLHEFDLVLLDVVMPEMDGVQVLEHIQRDPVLSEVPVLMMSALDEIGGVARCLEKGAADYLTKPLDPVMLRARMRSTLQIRRLHEDIRHAEQQLQENASAMQRLARSIAPDVLAASLQRGEIPASAQYADVTAVVVRFEGADALASRMPGEIAGLVGQALTAFERCARARDFLLTRMTDRSYTAIAGAPEWHEQHPRLAAELAIELRDCFRTELATSLAPLNVKLGLHTGLLTIGVAGNERLVLGLWGDAVATADAIAVSAPLGQVRLSNATSSRLGSGFVADDPMIVEVPGRGSVPTRALKRDQSASTGTRG